MRLRTELAAAVLAFVVIILLLVFASIGLFVRMGPAIDRILTRNDATIVAAEEVLASLAACGGGIPSESTVAATRDAIRRARENITEPREPAILQEIESHLDAALGGDMEERRLLLVGVADLIEVNRAAMRKVDGDAQRLGRAGAWVAAAVGLFSMLLSVFFVRLLGSRVVFPIRELHSTLEAVLSGDRFRRASAQGASPELRQVLESVNALLDDRVAGAADEAPPASPEPGSPA